MAGGVLGVGAGLYITNTLHSNYTYCSLYQKCCITFTVSHTYYNNQWNLLATIFTTAMHIFNLFITCQTTMETMRCIIWQKYIFLTAYTGVKFKGSIVLVTCLIINKRTKSNKINLTAWTSQHALTVLNIITDCKFHRLRHNR
jgi:hypothetical protein